MSTAESHDDGQPVAPVAKKRRNWWVWISALLALVAVGLLVWALAVKSDQESTQDELASTKQQLEKSKQQEAQATPTATPADQGSGGGGLLAAGGLAAAKAVYDDLTAQLGATQEDLATTEQDLKDADAKAKQAEQDAAAAEKQAAGAKNDTDKAKAEADKAKADAKAAESKATIAADCAKSYFSAFGTLFEGNDVAAQASKIREQLKGITSDCKAALGAT